MYTDPDGRETNEDQVTRLLWEDTHDLADTRLGPLRIYTRWWGEEDRPWLTRAWVGDTLIGRQWTRDKAAAHAAHVDWVNRVLHTPHRCRTRTLPTPTRRTLADPYGTLTMNGTALIVS